MQINDTRIIQIFEGLVSKYVSGVAGYHGGGDNSKSNKDHYAFIPAFSDASLIRGICKAVDIIQEQQPDVYTNDIKFLDCGCGIGNIVLLASACVQCQCHGIEYDRETYKMAKQMVRYQHQCEVFHGNIRYFRHYSDYDIIYYFTPICNGKMMQAFREKVAREAKPGAIIIPKDGSDLLHRHPDFTTIKGSGRAKWTPYMYLKGKRKKKNGKSKSRT